MHQTLALAGLFQAAQLVREIAWQGNVSDPQAYAASIESILKIDADSPLDVYGGVEGVALGLRVLLSQISGGQTREIEITRYGATLLHLERKLAGQRGMLGAIGEEIEAIKQLDLEEGPTSPVLISRIADVYRRTISTMQPRVMVQGDQGYLSRTDLADQIRALLLAGIRSAVLWRQTGGSRLRLLFFRGRTQRAVNAWLERLPIN